MTTRPSAFRCSIAAYASATASMVYRLPSIRGWIFPAASGLRGPPDPPLAMSVNRWDVLYASGASLSGSTLINCGFRDCNRCKMLGLRFDTCNRSRMRGVDFTEDDMSDSLFGECDFQDATFDGTVLERADFRSSENYRIDPTRNRIKKAKFSWPGVAG